MLLLLLKREEIIGGGGGLGYNLVFPNSAERGELARAAPLTSRHMQGSSERLGVVRRENQWR